MHDSEVFFVIPTYRLREVGETVERYDEHFWRNGHAVPIIVFDDSSPANQEKYYPCWSRPAPIIASTTSVRARRTSFLPTSTNVCATSGWWD